MCECDGGVTEEGEEEDRKASLPFPLLLLPPSVDNNKAGFFRPSSSPPLYTAGGKGRRRGLRTLGKGGAGSCVVCGWGFDDVDVKKVTILFFFTKNQPFCMGIAIFQNEKIKVVESLAQQMEYDIRRSDTDGKEEEEEMGEGGEMEDEAEGREASFMGNGV